MGDLKVSDSLVAQNRYYEIKPDFPHGCTPGYSLAQPIAGRSYLAQALRWHRLEWQIAFPV